MENSRPRLFFCRRGRLLSIFYEVRRPSLKWEGFLFGAPPANAVISLKFIPACFKVGAN